MARVRRKRGFCLVFDTSTLIRHFDAVGFDLGECEYADPADSKILRRVVTGCLLEIRELLRSVDKTESRSLYEEMSNKVVAFALSLARQAPFLKHPGFSEESEWRFVSKFTELDTEIRDGPDCLVPFVKVSLGELLPAALKKIVIGPCADPSLTSSSLKATLEALGYDRVEVAMSHLPFRTSSIGR